MQQRSTTITYLGYTTWRSQFRHFGIKEADRFNGMYIVGKTGMGKTSLLLSMILQDIANGKGVAVLDPHGDMAATLIEQLSITRNSDVIYFNPTDPENTIGFNPLADIEGANIHLQAIEIVSSIKKLFADSWGYRLEYILRYTILTLLHIGGKSLLDIQPLLLDKIYRTSILRAITNEQIQRFWEQEFERFTPSMRHEIISSILNKSGVFLADNTLKRIVGVQQGINIAEIMNEGRILIVNLSKGMIGEQACVFLGSLITSAIQLAAMQRSRISFTERHPFFFYLDEVQNFINPTFSTLLSECRKYALGIVMAHQYIDQLPEEMRNAIFGNIGTMIAFRLGTKDARIFTNEFFPVFTAEDFINLPRFYFYIKLLIDGVASKAFSAVSGEP